MNFYHRVLFFVAGAALFLASPSSFARPLTCYEMFATLQVQRIGGVKGRENTFAGSDVPMVRAFEKEGLFYADIVKWFDRADRKQTLAIVERRLDAEALRKTGKKLENFIKE